MRCMCNNYYIRVNEPLIIIIIVIILLLLLFFYYCFIITLTLVLVQHREYQCCMRVIIVFVSSDKMVLLGYNQSDIVLAVEKNQCNEMMATYLLLHQQYVVSAVLCFVVK